MKNRKTVCILTLLLGVFLFKGEGYAQFTSTFQNAQPVGKGNWEITGWYNSTSAGYDGESDGVLNIFGIMTGVGLSDQTEIRVRYDRMAFKESDGDGLNNIMVGPKFSNKSGKFAFYLPLGIAFDEYDTNWMTEPSFIFSFPIGQMILINTTPSYLIPFGDESGLEDGLVKLNLGLEVKIEGDWSFRPEATLMYFAGSIGDGHFLNLGIGVAKRL